MYLLFDIMTSMLLLCNTHRKKKLHWYLWKKFIPLVWENWTLFSCMYTLLFWEWVSFFFISSLFESWPPILFPGIFHFFIFGGLSQMSWRPLTEHEAVLSYGCSIYCRHHKWCSGYPPILSVVQWPPVTSVFQPPWASFHPLSKLCVIAWILIGPSHCLLRLWLITLINLVLVFQLSFENRSKSSIALTPWYQV